MGRYREVHVHEWMPLDFPDKDKRAGRWVHAVLAVDAALQSPLHVVEWEGGLTLLCGVDGKRCDRAHFVEFPVAAPDAQMQLPVLLGRADEDTATVSRREFTARVLSAARAIARGELPAAPPAPAAPAVLPEELNMHVDLVLRVGDDRAPLEQRIELPLNEALFPGFAREVRFVLGGVPLAARVAVRPDCPVAPEFQGDRDVRLRIELELSDDRGRGTTRLYWLAASVAIAHRRVALRSFEVDGGPRPLPIARPAQVLLDRIETSIEHTALRFDPP